MFIFIYLFISEPFSLVLKAASARRICLEGGGLPGGRISRDLAVKAGEQPKA